MSLRDNTIDRFLNHLSRVVFDQPVYNHLGHELGFAQYELDGKWTNANANVHLAAGRILTDWNNRTVDRTKFIQLAEAFKSVGLDKPYVEAAVKNKCQMFIPAGYQPSFSPPPPSYDSVHRDKEVPRSVEETSQDSRTTVSVSESTQPVAEEQEAMEEEEEDDNDEEDETENVTESFAAMSVVGGGAGEGTPWDGPALPEAEQRWNQAVHAPSSSLDVTSVDPQIALVSPEAPFFRLMMESFYNLQHRYTAHAVIINNCCAEFKGRNQFGDPEPGRLEKSTDRHRDVLKSMGCKVDCGKDMKGQQLEEFLGNLSRASFSDSNMFWITVVCHGDEKGRLKDANKQTVRDFSVDRIIEIACRNKSLVNKPKIFFFMACKGLDYDAGQQIALGTQASVPPGVVPTYADVLAAFPTWQGDVALFVPNNDSNGERMNVIEYLNELLEPEKLPRPRRLATVLKLWKRYQADSVFRTKYGNNVKQTPWVQDSLRDDVYL